MVKFDVEYWNNGYWEKLPKEYIFFGHWVLNKFVTLNGI